MLERRPPPHDGHERDDEDHEKDGLRACRGRAPARAGCAAAAGRPNWTQLALPGQGPSPRAHQDVAHLAQVAREEDDDRELRELGRLELDRADLHRQVGAVHLLADPGQAGHHEQRDAHRRDRVAVALEHVVVAQEDDRGAEEGQPDHEPLRLLARQLWVDPVDLDEAERSQRRREREQVGVRVRQPRADEQVREHAEAEEDRAVGDRDVADVLAAGEQHGGEARGDQQRDRDQREQLPDARRGGHRSSRPCSMSSMRSTASSRPRHSWSSTRPRRLVGIAVAGTPLAYSSSYSSTPSGRS